MNEYSWNLDQSPSIAHFGILGMHWGVRRYQNADGSLTAAGKKRYDEDDNNASSGSARVSSKKSYNSALAKKSAELQNQSDEYEKKARAKEEAAYKEWRKTHPRNDADDFGDWLTTEEGSKVDYGERDSDVAFKLSIDAERLGKNYIKNSTKNAAITGVTIGAIMGRGLGAGVKGAALGGALGAALGWQIADIKRAETAAKYGYKRNL